MSIFLISKSETRSLSRDTSVVSDPRVATKKHTGRLKDKGDVLASILSLERDDVVVVGALEDLAHRGHVDAELDRAVAAVGLKALGAEEQSNKRNVAAVHGLELNTSARALKVGLGDEILDGLEDLLEKVAVRQTSLKHDVVSFGLTNASKPKP